MLEADDFQQAGALWVRGTHLEYLAGMTGRFRPRSGALMPQFAGYETFFCDFNRAEEFSLGLGGGYPGLSGAHLAAEAVPGGTAAADATAPNLNALHMWARNNIGTPTTIHFWSDRMIGGEMNSAVKIGCQDIGHGFMAYDPLSSLTHSAGNTSKEFGFLTRVRKQTGTVPTGASFFGFSEGIVFGSVPLTTAGAVNSAAEAYYFGFHISTTDRISIVYNLASGAQILYDTGVQLLTSYSNLEIRAAMVNDGATTWVNGYIDFYVDGVKILRTGTASLRANRTLQPSDIAGWPSTHPVTVAMAVVKTAGASLNPLYQVDAIGTWQSRLVNRP